MNLLTRRDLKLTVPEPIYHRTKSLLSIAKRTQSSLSRLLFFIIISFSAILLDLWSKAYIFSRYSDQSHEVIGNFLVFQKAENRGIAFGMLQNHPSLLKILIPLLLLVLLIYSLRHLKDPSGQVACLAFIFGGACGNMYDRMQLGYVRDFIEVNLPFYSNFPIFNIADAFISCGVAMLMLLSFLHEFSKKS